MLDCRSSSLTVTLRGSSNHDCRLHTFTCRGARLVSRRQGRRWRLQGHMIPRAENINPSILKWARETAGMSLEDAAVRLGFTSSARRVSAARLEALERGESKPTRNQLLKIAATYRRPLTAFYRATPPVPGNRGEDFRSIGGVSDKSEPLLDALLRDTRARQDMVRSLLEDDEDVESLSFVGSLPITEPIEDAARTIRIALRVDENRHARASSAEQFATLRERVEALGVFVLLAGNLGSHHTNLDERVFRGFAVADQIAPFIVINDQDATAAQSFTLIHELIHVYAGSTGVSAAPTEVPPRTHPARVERFCNDVASEVLLPHGSLPRLRQGHTVDAAADQISEVAVGRNVSEAMVAYRYWRTGALNAEVYRRLAAAYAARWQTARARRRELRQAAAGSGPSFYTVRKHRLGQPLINLVERSLRSNELTHTKAALILGVKPSSVEPLLRGSPNGRPARQTG